MSKTETALEKAAKLRSTKNMSERPRQLSPGTAYRDNPYLVTISDPTSPVAEEYRKLKSSLIRLTKKDQFKNVLLVTSSVGGEGKSITALNLALSLSQDYDHSVLLIDADLRMPSLQRYLNVTAETGLSDCLVDGIDVGAALIRIGEGNLTFLPSGKKNEKPVELFSSKKMEKLIYDMKYRYPDRYIVIDTPPALLFAETKMMSALVDGVIFVIQENKVSPQNVSETLETLKDASIMGIVYNNVSVENLNGRYNYHSYYRYYGKDRKGV